MTNRGRLLGGFFGCFCTLALCLAQSDLSVAPSLLPEESNPSVMKQVPVTSPALPDFTADQAATDNSPPQPDSVHSGKTQEQLLAELRDVYAPAKPSWWPLAPGWWVLGAAIIILFGLLVSWLYRFLVVRRKNNWKKSACAEHQRLCELAANKSVPSTAIIADASVLMRRVSLAQFPREQIASLTDGQWLDALDGLGNNKAYSQGVGKLLTRHPYMRPHDIAESEVDELLKLIKKTINNAPSTLLQEPRRSTGAHTLSMKPEPGVV